MYNADNIVTSIIYQTRETFDSRTIQLAFSSKSCGKYIYIWHMNEASHANSNLEIRLLDCLLALSKLQNFGS